MLQNLASFHTDKSSWIAEAGKYTIKIGASSEDIKQTSAFDLAKGYCNKKKLIEF